jgi:hypothetical protein
MNELALIPSITKAIGSLYQDYTFKESYHINDKPYFIPIILIQTTPSTNSSVVIREPDDKTEIVNNFITKLVKGSKDLESKLYNIIEENFWDLI